MYKRTYNPVRRWYELHLEKEIEEKIENEEMTEEEAAWYFQEKMEDWEWGYGDELYDSRNDR